MHVDPNSPRAERTKRQQEVLDRLRMGLGAKQIATDIGVSRNAVYQHIERLRRDGALAPSYTPSGQPPRKALPLGHAAPAAAGISPRDSSLGRLRELAIAEGAAAERGYAEALEAAIASGDATALAYELGRLDAGDEADLPREMVEAALRRLGALPAPQAER